MDLFELRDTAKALFLKGVAAADPMAAVARALKDRPLPQLPAGGHLYLIAYGKAACAMMQAALGAVPEGQPCTALAVTNYENARDIGACTVLASGHPWPDENGLTAGRKVMALLEKAGPQDAVLCLISGGGSALLPTPRDGLTLADKRAVNDVLLSGGLDIHQMNAVRQKLSVLKGGGLLRMAAPAPVRALIISDVVGDDLAVIASGPTTAPLDTQANAAQMLRDAGLWDRLPAAAQTLLEAAPLPHTAPEDNTLICSNRHSLEAIRNAATRSFETKLITDQLTGDVADVAPQLVKAAAQMPLTRPQLLIWGGETTVTLKGDGAGGRNQELALRFARDAQDMPGTWVFLSGGTDGRDGPTDAAGGMVDAATLHRIASAGMDVDAALARNDSYPVLQAAGDLVICGASGTNVADIQLLLRLP